jgi:hypothetical protein
VFFLGLPYYGHFKFFEQRMRAHSQVSNLTMIVDGRYDLTTFFEAKLKVFICECYSYGVAEYTETTVEHGKLDVIIINSNWCGYTLEAKRLCRSERVGLFKIADFMSALNKANYWEHLNESEREAFTNKGWT